MAKINILSKDIFNKISAGEVVERPSSIVKELFENSVDAGASSIVVEIENGGINQISVTDDGCGIEKSELEKVFFPHATSKISKVSDINAIATLGFRGEAMSSISAVSKVKLISKTKDDDIGSYILVEGGEFVDRGEIPTDNGTKIIVTGIFYNTPARLKFLKSPKGEENEVTSLMEKLILSNPNISVKYIVNGKIVFQSFGDGLKNALIAVYGNKTVENCIEISTIKNGIKIEGFLGNINFYKSTKLYQTLIVNGRSVTDATVSSAISNAYRTYLMKRQYPFYVLCLTVSPEIVDVNVHPRKAEIRFANNQIIYSSIYSVVTKVIDGSTEALEITKTPFSPIFENENKFIEKNITSVAENPSFIEEDKPISLDVKEEVKTETKTNQDNKRFKKYIDNNFNVVYRPYEFEELPKQRKYDISDHIEKVDFTNEEFVKKCELDEIFAENKRYIAQQEELKQATEQQMDIELEMKYIGCVFDTFLLFEFGKNIYIVDQHAAHERLVYDKLLAELSVKKLSRQDLLIPYSIKVNASEFDLVYDLIDYLRPMGFAIEYYDDTTFRIYSVPYELYDINLEKFIFDIITDSNLKTEKVPQVIKEKLMQKACKSAIKAGDKLSEVEIESLMSQLKNDFSLKCPHGRPIAVKITKTEIDKWFKRIV